MSHPKCRDAAFKRILKAIERGTERTLGAAYGSFALRNDASVPAVFLSGGIGVTPVRSIVLHAAHDKLPHSITLVYSNRRPEDSAFPDDLTNAEKQNPDFKLVATVTQMEKSTRPRRGEIGFIDRAMLARSTPNLARPIYSVSGPRGLVTAIRKILGESGVTDDDVRTEEFSDHRPPLLSKRLNGGPLAFRPAVC